MVRVYTDEKGRKRPLTGNRTKRRYASLKHGQRWKIARAPGYYFDRDRKGQFHDVVGIHRSIRRDMATSAKTQYSSKEGSGKGNMGDYPKGR